ncbi:MAG: hypothetical protein QG597_4166 [Actinomycetota bacterium]|nr:hypothetical protein [Actinomycetota bacterium]
MSSRSFPSRSRRRPMLLAVGVAAATLGAMAGAWTVSVVGQRQMVVVMARAVAVGSVIQAADLAVTPISADTSIPHLTLRDRDRLVGKIATSDLVAGSVVAPGQIADTVGKPGPGEAIAVIVLPATRIPAVGLRAGDPVLLVLNPTDQIPRDPMAGDQAAADNGVSSTVGYPGTVVRVGSADATSMVGVDVLLPEAQTPAIAARAAEGKVSIALRSRMGR